MAKWVAILSLGDALELGKSFSGAILESPAHAGIDLYKVTSGTNQGQWRWRMKASNREIFAHGESHHNKSDAEKVIALIKAEAAYAPTIEVNG